MKEKVKKALKRVNTYFSRMEKEKAVKRSKLKDALELLAEREEGLHNRLKKETHPEKRKNLRQELDIIFEQRKKGEELLARLDADD